MMRPLLILVLLSTLTGCSWLGEYFSGEENLEPPTPLQELKQEIRVEKLWSVDTGSGSGKQMLRLRPALTDSTVYTADYKGNLYAVRIADGKQLWQVESGIAVSSGPGAGDGLVLIGGQNGEVVAYAEADGRELWRTEVSSEVLSVPAVSDGVVVVRTIDGRIRALNAVTGKRMWIYNRKEPVLTLRGISAPLVDGDVTVVGFDNGKLAVLSLDRGQLMWESTIAVPSGRSELERMVDIDGDPVIGDGIVYVASYQGRVAALTLASGTLLWTRDMSSYAGIAIDRHHLYVTNEDSEVLALDRNTGASLWRQDKLKYRFATAPAVVDDYVVVADFEGYLHWLSSEDGHLVARLRSDDSGTVSAPGVVGNTLIVQGKSGNLYAYRVQP